MAARGLLLGQPLEFNISAGEDHWKRLRKNSKCGNVYAKTIPYTIAAVSIASISFESKTDIQGHYGAFFISSRGIPAPELKTTYNPVQIAANAERTIKVRAYFRTNSAVSVSPAFNIDREIDFELPALP